MIRRRDLLLAMPAGLAASALPRDLALAQTVVPTPAAEPKLEPKLPAGFTLGASTSSYQIEGAVNEDGRGASIWDTFSHTPGRIKDGSNGDVACDHYHRFAEDVELMAQAGFGSYRFSVAWPRVQPDGAGAPNVPGLDFYDRLTDRLLARGVKPFACLYHWDLPQALQDKSGWTNRDIVGRFTDYAQLVATRLGDRVPRWAMLNEPSVHAIFGHAFGNHAPGMTGWKNYLAAQHHMNLAQGSAIRALRAAHPKLGLGTVFSLQPVLPATGKPEDAAAAVRFDAAWNGNNLDPLFHGRYPEISAADFAPFIREGDLDAIKVPVDFLGVNYYGRAHVVDDPNGVIAGAGWGPHPPGTRTTAMGWPIEPQGLVEVLARLRDDYGNPQTFITENGAAYDDPAPKGGTVDDPARTAFIRDHLLACQRAIADGCALKGYYVWSLLDNFEWAEGYSRRFGIIHVDFATLQRTPKASFAYLAAVASGAPTGTILTGP
ncbi:beta-glucosidase [Ancylobacter sonchi]|uniref:GH1 family beta-glucosidase n=1 Tax=Ancylobacter sonchi TaxID=1937790 RepID=UPI001BD28E9A|nr:GH1 family beta-glucosidase [Ancylobacter sonchi]MBS7536996.1 beta-glucosidase [Ancylobacter sonchi]